MLLHKTPLHQNHVAHGAKLVEFAGWEMPLQFGKVLDEHHAVRNTCGLFDISHMGLLSLYSGSTQKTMDALNYLVPQDLTKLYPGKAVYTQLLNENGGIIDDIIVYWMPPTSPHFSAFPEFLVICNAANTEKDIQWMKQHLPTGVQLNYCNPQYSLLALQGPRFQQVLEACGLTSGEALPKRFHLMEGTLCDVPVLLSRTGYTGEDGVEIVVSTEKASFLWEKLLEVGQAVGLKPVGLAARDTLRLEAAYPLHGAELTEAITPLEAGLGWSVKLDKTADFIGKSALQAQRQSGLSRHFVCFEVRKKSIPRHHDLLYDKEGNILGEVTSGSISPSLGKPIGVGYISSPHPFPIGQFLFVGIRGQMVDAVLVERPFYQSKK